MTYSLSADLFKEMDYKVISDILFPFCNCQLPDIKIAIDSNRAILDRYKNNTPEEFRDLLSIWEVLLIRNLDTSITKVEIDLTPVPNDEYCLMVASSINGDRALIVNSKQRFPYRLIGAEVEYHGERIIVYEKEEAKQQLNSRGHITQVNTMNQVNANNSSNLNINNNSNNGQNS